MSKTVLKVFVVLFVASVLSVGSAFALNPIARDDSGRVTVGQNGYGDVLLGQIYQSLSNYETKIKVINSSTNVAVVARVLFKSATYSCDVFDFNIYLTPTDAWEGIVRINASGNVEIFSDDDSVMSSEQFDWDGTSACNPFDGVWGNEVPLHREFYSDCLTGGDLNEFGHFEVIGLTAFPATPPLSKDTLAMASHLYNQIDGLAPSVPINRLIDCDYNLLGTPVDVPNVLTGTIVLENTSYGQKASINMIALKNFDIRPLTGFRTGAPLYLHNSSFNSIPEIEAALAKTSYSFPFDFSADGDNDIIIINTLPTRYEAATGRSAYPGLSGGICGLTYRAYDMEETLILDILSGNTRRDCLPEVSMQMVSPLIADAMAAGYVEGWINVLIPGGGTGLSATGRSGLGLAPNAPSFVQFIESGLSYPVVAGANDDLAPYTHVVSYAGAPSIHSTIVLDRSNDMMWKYAASPESVVTYSEDLDGDNVLDPGEDANQTGALGTYTVRQ
ncbi:exported hypothetical protein [Desulfamplus magnetovallimortis]|uniref:Uncharacterized protein n=2 Tax=Desulfamplus magnetovallimortis TaxID=1246637 RepID=A0A1W1HC55_9BACT|nr:exported hypothetical protein [Desulfamplus magnetovallimortis]